VQCVSNSGVITNLEMAVCSLYRLTNVVSAMYSIQLPIKLTHTFVSSTESVLVIRNAIQAETQDGL